MKIKGKINVLGAIASLNEGDVIKFPRKLYKPSSIRSSASIVTSDTGIHFFVSATKDSEFIIVKRKHCSHEPITR